MPHARCAFKMAEAIANLRTGIRGVELDVHKECLEEWGTDYAVALVSIIEPEEPEFYNLDLAIDRIVAVVADCFGRSFKVAHSRMDDPKSARQVLRFHRLGAGWELEIEAYRKKAKSKAS